MHIDAKPEKNQTEEKRPQLQTQFSEDGTPSAEAIEKRGVLLDKSEENKSNEGVFQAIYSSQGEIKKNNSVETQLVKKSDYVRVSL